MGTRLIVNVPLPPQGLKSNGSQGTSKWARMKRARLAKEYRESVCLMGIAAARDAGWKAPYRARVSLLAGTGPSRFPRDGLYRPKDPPNLIAALKGLYDGLQDAGILMDDDAKHMEMGSLKIDPSREAGITVEIEVLEA